MLRMQYDMVNKHCRVGKEKITYKIYSLFQVSENNLNSHLGVQSPRQMEFA